MGCNFGLLAKKLYECLPSKTNCKFFYRTGYTLLRTSEELIETLEENQVQLQNMMTSKYIAFFYDEISTWQKRLSNVDQVICCWIDVQRTWSHLESIFIGSEDIRKQLPVDSERFDDIDAEFKKLMAMMAKTPNVVKATNVPGKYRIWWGLLRAL